MSVILEAVRAEIAKVEQEHEKQLKTLREIESLALQLNGDEPTEAELEEQLDREEPPSPPAAADDGEPQSDADSAEKSRGPVRYSDERIEAAARQVLANGHATPNKIVAILGTKSTPVRRRVEEWLAREEADGRIVPDQPVRGRASFKLAPEEPEPSPYPPAPAPTTSDAGATLEDRAPVHAPGLPAEARAAAERLASDSERQVVDELDDYQPPRAGGETMAPDLQPLADRIKDSVSLEPHTTREIADRLEIEDLKLVRRVTEKLVRMGQLQQRGWDRDSHPRYSTTPSLESRGVTVKQADRAAPLETRILEFIDEAGSLSIRDLAVETVAHPRDVAAAVTALIERRELKKRRAHPDAVYERPDAV